MGEDFYEEISEMYVKTGKAVQHEHCPVCNGSGEGMSDGTNCRACKGTGEKVSYDK